MEKYEISEAVPTKEERLDCFEEEMDSISEQNLFQIGVVDRVKNMNRDLEKKHIIFIIDFVCEKFAEHK